MLTQAFTTTEMGNERNGDRPFILAGHSQGTFHAARLLGERIAGTPLAEKMVAACLVGYFRRKAKALRR